jgi:hypothetical protein
MLQCECILRAIGNSKNYAPGYNTLTENAKHVNI